MSEKYDALKLENQICFPLYACSKEVIKAYKPYLDKLDLTYTQYITMMVLWENKEIRAKDLGKKLYLESNTLTPMLKRLEDKGYISRKRSEKDKRDLIITITDKGEALKEKAVTIPAKLVSCIKMDTEEAQALYCLLYELLDELSNAPTLY